jgi:hypothetical protein
VLWIRAGILQQHDRPIEALAMMQKALPLDPARFTTFGPEGADFISDNKEGVVAQGWLPKGWSDATAAHPMGVTYRKLSDPPLPGLTAVEMKTESAVANFAHLTGPRIVCKKNEHCLITGWARSPFKSDLTFQLSEIIEPHRTYSEQTVRTTSEWKQFKLSFNAPCDLAAELVICEPSGASVHFSAIAVQQQ